MNLIDLSAEAGRVTGKSLGFTIKSLAYPERKFLVEAVVSGGKFAITRLDTGKSYFVAGTEDRYDFVVAMSRISELMSEKAHLIEALADVTAELTSLGGVG